MGDVALRGDQGPKARRGEARPVVGGDHERRYLTGGGVGEVLDPGDVEEGCLAATGQIRLALDIVGWLAAS